MSKKIKKVRRKSPPDLVETAIFFQRVEGLMAAENFSPSSQARLRARRHFRAFSLLLPKAKKDDSRRLRACPFFFLLFLLFI